MICTWRITFELLGVNMGPVPHDSMIVRAPTAEDALTMFKVKFGSVSYKVLGMSLYEAIGPATANCPICSRRWSEHLAERSTCVFQHGWLLERQLGDVERLRIGLAPRPASG